MFWRNLLLSLLRIWVFMDFLDSTDCEVGAENSSKMVVIIYKCILIIPFF